MCKIDVYRGKYIYINVDSKANVHDRPFLIYNLFINLERIQFSTQILHYPFKIQAETLSLLILK